MLDIRLDEGADPPSALAQGVARGFGGPRPEPGGAAVLVRDRLAGLLPEAGRLQCASHFRSSYAFAVGLLGG